MSESKCEIVPRVLIQNGGGAGQQGSCSLVESMLRLMSGLTLADSHVNTTELGVMREERPGVRVLRESLKRAVCVQPEVVLKA